MEKFITLDHLKKAVQSLILDTDSKINGLPTAARTGDYNDLTNKPNENLTPYGYLEYENGYYRLYTNADKILQETGASFIEFPVFLNGINNYEYVNYWDNYLYLNDATTANYKIAFERKSSLREEKYNWMSITSSEDWDEDFEKYFGTTSNFFSCHLGEFPDGYDSNENNSADTLYVQNYKPFQKNEIPYIYHTSAYHYDTTNDTSEYVGRAFYKEITSDYQFKCPITATDIGYNHNQLVNIVQPDSENALSIDECILCVSYSDYVYGSGFVYKFCPIDNTLNYYWRAYHPYNAQNSLESWRYFDSNGAIIFQKVYEEKVIPDWNENNSTADDYIQNRTHYIEEVNNYTWCENLEFSFTTAVVTSLKLFDLNTTDIAYGSYFKPGASYTVTLDNTDYSFAAYEFKNTNTGDTTGIAIGNSSLLSATSSPVSGYTYNSSIPFVIYKTYSSSVPQSVTFRRDSTSILNNTNHVITIKGYAPIAHKIDNKYLNGKLITHGSGTKAEIFNNENNIASGAYSHAEGSSTKASATDSHAEGCFSIASGSWSHAEGYSSIASGVYSHAEGHYTTASGDGSHSEGLSSAAAGQGSHAEGNYAYLSNVAFTKEANSLTCLITNPSQEVDFSNQLTPENFLVSISGTSHYVSNILVSDNKLTGFTLQDSFKEDESYSGTATIYIGNLASGKGSHAEGGVSWAGNDYAHAEGWSTVAKGNSSHAEGYGAYALAQGSHAEGRDTIASSQYQHVQGKFNIEDTNNTYADIVGNGTADNARSNAYTLDWSGNGVYAGKLTVGAGPTENMDVATKQYVDTAMSNVSTDLVGLTDTTISNPTNDQILKYDSTTSKWINDTLALTTDLTGLTDTTITNPAEGQILSYDSTNSKWINITSPYLTETQVNALIETALAAYGDGDTATYGYTDGNEVNY